MAAFTSVTNGNWNDGATWGNTSPGVKGTDWPGTAGDTFTIASGHTVTYNVSEANELGASTINGKLGFITTGSTKLAFGNVSLTVGATGELEIGTTAAPIGAAYTSELLFNTTGDNANGLSITSGGAMHICGADYCTDYQTTLANNAENTDDDAVIITTDDMSSDWHAGDEIIIQREYVGDSTSNTDAIIKRTIDSISGTSITLTETVTGMVAGVGSTWTSVVINVTRNVKIYKSGAVTDIQSSSRYNTNRPFLNDNNTGTNTNYIKNAQITGINRILINGATFTNNVIRNGQLAFNLSNSNTISGVVYSYAFGLNSSYLNTVSADLIACGTAISASCQNNISGNIIATGTGFSLSNNNIFSGNMHCCNTGVTNSNYNKISGCIYSSVNMLYTANNNELTGKIGIDSVGSSFPNTNDIRDECRNNTLANCTLPSAGLSFYDRNLAGRYQSVLCEHLNKVLNSHKIYHNKGDIVKTPCDGSGTSPSADPDGGSLDCIEISNLQSNLSAKECIEAFLPQRYQIYAVASTSKTYTFKFQSTFTDTLANTEVILIASYLSSTDGTRTEVSSTGTIAARSTAADWTQSLNVSVNPSQDGFVDIQIRLCKYESGKKLYIWPKVAIS